MNGSLLIIAVILAPPVASASPPLAAARASSQESLVLCLNHVLKASLGIVDSDLAKNGPNLPLRTEGDHLALWNLEFKPDKMPGEPLGKLPEKNRLSPSLLAQAQGELSQEGGDLRVNGHDSNGFWIQSSSGLNDFSTNLEGKPFILLDPRTAKDSSIAHELSHFRDWRAARDHILDLRYRGERNPETLARAGLEAQILLNDPDGRRVSELRAVREELQAQSSAVDRHILDRDFTTALNTLLGDTQVNEVISAREKIGNLVKQALYPHAAMTQKATFYLNMIDREIPELKKTLDSLNETLASHPDDFLRTQVKKDEAELQVFVRESSRLAKLREEAMTAYVRELASRIETLRQDRAKLMREHSPEMVEALFQGFTDDVRYDHPLDDFHRFDQGPKSPNRGLADFYRKILEAFLGH